MKTAVEAIFAGKGRRAGHRLDEIMAAYLKEAAIVLPVHCTLGQFRRPVN